MAKVQGKKTAAGARKRPGKKAAPRSQHAKARPKKPVRKPVAAKKKPLKPPKPAARPAAKAHAAPRVAAHPHPAGHKPAVKHPAPPAAAPAEKKRARRARPRLHSGGPIVAAWFAKEGEKPRPSSFIPAPHRAEAPSLIAAPPASSDRLVSTHELTEFAVRTVPVRVDVEARTGRVYLAINPDEVVLRVGEGIEWDFRYLAGADVIVDELLIEFEKPSPFSHSQFRSRRPGTARPHRQLSGPAQKSAAGKSVHYAIRAINSFKTEMAVARLSVVIQ